MKDIKESVIEKWLSDEVRKCGGLSFKWVSPGCIGVPDRIIVYQGKVWFVELKTTTGRLSPTQKAVIRKLSDAGMVTHVVYGKDQARKLLHEIFGDKIALQTPTTTQDYGIEEWKNGGRTRL